MESGYRTFLGWVEVAEGKIKALGEGEPPSQENVYDCHEGDLYPGFIDIHCHLGMIEDSLGFEGDDCNESTDPISPQLRAADAINPFDPGFKEARNAGITCVVTGPGSGNPISGQMVAVKTLGRCVDEMILGTPAMKFALGENPKSVYNEKNAAPMTRMATAALIREALKKAQRYGDDCRAAELDPDLDPPEIDVKSEALLPVLSREQKAHFHCHRADDIVTALRIAKEFKLDLLLIHATEGHMVSDLLAAGGYNDAAVPAVVGPVLLGRSKPELKNLTTTNAATLHNAGVPLAICTDHPEVPIQYLPLSAAIAIKGGLPKEAALKSITIRAARLAGLEDRLGSITVGKDADFVLFSKGAEPLDVLSSPVMTMVDGHLISHL